MEGSLLFSLGLMMLLLGLACGAVPKEKRFFGWPPMGGDHHGPPMGGDHHGPPPGQHHGPPPGQHHGHGPQPGGMSAWSSWSSCSKSCGGGTRSRTRTCIRPWKRFFPPFNHPVCVGPLSQTETCSSDPCQACQDGIRIRKDFTSMKEDDRRRYIRAVKVVSTDSRFKRDYESLLQDHNTLFLTEIHKKKHFLTWHRWFTLQYENLLRRVDCSVTVPYWDWSSSNPFDTSDKGLWNDKDYGFGGNGTGNSFCVQTGPFKEGEWSILPPTIGEKVDCLARSFGQTPSEAEVQELLSIPAAKFTEFEVTLRDVLHFNVHKGVGGTMFTDNSAAAPVFFLVHAFVDKIWHDWQKKSEEYKNAFFPTVDQIMPCTKSLPKEVIDLSNLPGGIKVKYEENAVVQRRGQSLIERPRISRELDPEIIKLFNVSPAEVEKVKEMGALVQPRNNAYRYE